MKANILNLSNTPWAGHLMRMAPPNSHKRKIMIRAKAVYKLVNPFVGYADWSEWYIQDTPLRSDIDYFYIGTNRDLILSISALQAVLVMNDTDKSWQLFNALSDLINNGFATMT